MRIWNFFTAGLMGQPVWLSSRHRSSANSASSVMAARPVTLGGAKRIFCAAELSAGGRMVTIGKPEGCRDCFAQLLGWLPPAALLVGLRRRNNSAAVIWSIGRLHSSFARTWMYLRFVLKFAGADSENRYRTA